ncbi:MAG: hypothetical protein E6Q97_31185 [Desulfurellales bacterium]|nr:MAG: hypothetical protein E6Q97_31185 [Desulfurellales bacterium]
MTTKNSPLRQLKAQADAIAASIKAVERGDLPAKPGSEDKPSLKFGVVMDDKVITIEIGRAAIKASSEAGLSEYILRLMREQRDAVH